MNRGDLGTLRSGSGEKGDDEHPVLDAFRYAGVVVDDELVKAGDPLVPVTILTTQSLVLAANPERGWKTVADVIAAAKAAPQGLHYATPSAGMQ